MSEFSTAEYLSPFIDATITASTRFRRVLIVVIVASTLAFGAFWNSRSGSWLNSRIRVAHNAQASLRLRDLSGELNDKTSHLKMIQEKLSNVGLDEENKKKLTAEYEKLLQEQEWLTGEKNKLEHSFAKDDLDNAEKWLTTRGIKEQEELKSYANRLDTSRVEYVILIRIPFFGVVLDVNDLGALGGFTFVVILMWFRFSLWREYYNLSSTFKAARTDEDLQFCYKTLAMSQVLTVPPALSENQPSERPWGKVVRTLYFLPIAVQLIVFVYDCISFNYGWEISPLNTVVGISMSLGFLFLSALLTYWCFRLSSEIDSEWETTASALKAKGFPNHSLSNDTP